MAEDKHALEMLKKACLEAPVLPFSNIIKPFLPGTNTNKLRLGTVLYQKQTDSQYHPVAYASQSLTIHEHNHHSTKQQFLAPKSVIQEQFWEYLLWKPFIVRTDTNPLNNILTTPTLDATQHWWIELLARFRFNSEYQKGWDNAVADALSWVTLMLDAETMKSILDGVTMRMTEREDAQDLAVAEGWWRNT